jgi:hypothetical protein
MRRCLFSAFLLLVTSVGAVTACVDPSTLVPGVGGVRGTGWFLSSRFIVTAAHVAGGHVSLGKGLEGG